MWTRLLTSAAAALVLASTGPGCAKRRVPAPEAPPGATPVVITTVAPVSGPVAGGTAMVITGSGYQSGAGVTVGGTPATGVVVTSATVINCVTPPGVAGPATVTVTNPDLSTGSAFAAYTYTSGPAPAPTITSVNPTFGPTGGGGTVTLTGTGFQTGATISVGGNAATNVVVLTASTLTFTVPAGSAGPASVTITNPDTQNATATNAYTYGTPAPTVTAVNPTSGPVAGGTVVTVSGTGFQRNGASQATVTFGAAAATGVQVLTATTLTCTTGASTVVGPVNVTVTNPDTQNGALNNGYTYVGPNPTVTGITPTSGPLAGGTTVTITGTGFFPGATVTIGGVAATVTSVTGTTIIATTGAGAAGPATVTVTNLDGNSGNLTNGYTYNPLPTITSITPNNGRLAGGNSVVIVGTGFINPVTSVTFGGTAGTVTAQTTTSLTVTAPAHAAGAVNVVVTNPDTQSVTAVNGYTYNPFPTITSITPNNGSQGGGNSVVIAGTGFVNPVTSVTFGGTAGTVTAQTTTSITVTVPASATTGAVNVVVTNPDTQSVTATNGYTYNAGPVITSIVPNNGPLAGGNTVTINGSGFALPITSVTFGGSSATIQGSPTTTQIIVTAPAGTGTVTVTVTVSGGATATTSYTYNPLPTITSITPNNGPQGGGNSVVIAGTGFINPVTSVTFGGAAGTVTAQTTTSITVTVPSSATTGAVNVVVTNPDTQSVTATNGYTYNVGPVITSIVPNNGPQAGGNTVTINGANFTLPITSVTFGGSSATIQGSPTTTQIIVTAPSGTGTVTVTVTVSGGATATTSYTYNPLPTITSITPNNGPLAGGNSVVIVGTGFVNPVTSVTFGGTAGTVTAQTGTSLTVTAPAHAAGAVNVVVTNPDTQSVTATNGYTYNPLPTITSITPNNGPQGGGNSVVIVGTGFINPVTSVTFGGTAGTVTAQTTTSLTVTVPASATTGAVNVVVTNPDTQSVTATNGYTYNVGPTITSIVPNNGPLAGGNTVTINGANFTLPITSVTFGGSSATIQGSPTTTQIIVTAPSGTGTVTVTVTVSGGATATTSYTYNPLPTITSITPNNGPLAGGNSVVIVGTGFINPVTSVTFGGAGATVTAQTATSLTVTVPAGTGPVNVVVTNPDTQSVTATNGYTYNPLPTITSITPNNGPVAGGQSVVIVGTGFINPVTSVTFGGTAGAVTAQTTTQLTVTTPAHAAGAVNVVVTNPDTQSVTATNGYTYNPLPTITSITPNNGPLAGGQSVVIVGTGFINPVTSVTFGGTAGTVTAQTTTSLTVTTPAHAAGAVNVVVTNPDTQSVTATNGYTYNPLPTITSITPNTGSTVGGTSVVIVGTGFINPVTSVTFAGTGGTVTAQTTTSITVTTPPGSAGAVNVTVTNPDTQFVTAVNGFTYTVVTTPTVTAVNPNSGPEIGGQLVTITGTNFVAPATVAFGLTNATNNVVVNGTTMTCTTPAGTPGVVNVSVTTTGGTGTLNNSYTYLPVQTLELTGATDWALQAGSNVDLLTSLGDVQLRRAVGGFFSSGTVVNVIAYHQTGATPQRILVGTNSAGAFLTTDGGTTWTPFNVYTSPPLPSNNVTTAAFFSGANGGNTFLMGTAAGAVLTTDGGTTFRVYNTISTPALPFNVVTSVGFFDGQTAGTGSRFMIASTNFAFFPSTGGTVFTTDGGNNFTLFNATSTPVVGSSNPTGVAFFSGDTVGNRFLIADYNGNGGNGGLFLTINGGTSFTRFHNASAVTTPGNQARAVAFFNGDTTGNTWLAGFDNNFGGAGGLLRTTDSLATAGNRTIWNTGSTPVLPSNDVSAVTWSSLANRFAAGTDLNGMVFTTNGATGGGGFTVRDTGSAPALGSDAVNGLGWFTGNTTTFAVASGVKVNGPPPTLDGAAQQTTNTGGALTTFALPNPAVLPHDNIRSVAIFRGNGLGNRILVGTSTGAALTTNGGTNWTVYTSTSTPALPADEVTSVAWYEGNTTGTHFLIGTTAGAVRSTDGGGTFAQTYTNGGAGTIPGNVVTSVAYFSGSTTDNLSILIGTTAGVAYTTNAADASNPPNAFTVHTTTVPTAPTNRLLPSNAVQSVAFFDGQTTSARWLVGTNNGLIRTTDAGATAGNWQLRDGASAPALANPNVLSCAYFNSDATGATYVIGTAGGATHTANDGGAYLNRTVANGLPNNQVDGVAYFSGTTAAGTFACACNGPGGAGGGVAFTTNTGTSFTVLNTASNPRLPIADGNAVDYDDSVAGGTRFVVGCESLNAGDTGGIVVETGVSFVPAGTLTADSLEGGVIPITPPLAPTFDDRWARSVAWWNGNTTGTRFVAGSFFGGAVTSNGGTVFSTFTEGSTPALPTSQVRAVAFARGDTTGNTFLLGTAFGAHLTTNGGTSFTAFTTGNGLPSNDVRAVAIHQNSTALRFLVGTVLGTARTNNGGTNFTTFAAAAGATNVVQALDYWDGDTTGQVWAIGGVQGQGIFHTVNDGTAFTNRTPFAGGPQSSDTRGLAYFNGDTTGQTLLVGHFTTGAAGGASLTINLNAVTPTWTLFNSTTVGTWPNNNVVAVDYFNGSTAAGTFLAAHGGGISHTVNNGAAWTHRNTTNGLPSNTVIGAAYFGGSATGAATMLAATDLGVARTTNSGANWSAFRRGTVSGYLVLNVQQTTPANTSITYQILDATGTLIPDLTLPGNSAGLTPDGSGNISLTAIPIATFPSIQVRARLATSASASTPVLHTLRVRFVY